MGVGAAQCLLYILYPVYNLFYDHEGHEECEGKRQSDLSNKVIACAIVVIKHTTPDCWNPRGTAFGLYETDEYQTRPPNQL